MDIVGVRRPWRSAGSDSPSSATPLPSTIVAVSTGHLSVERREHHGRPRLYGRDV